MSLALFVASKDKKSKNRKNVMYHYIKSDSKTKLYTHFRFSEIYSQV